ncbi:hypothetical protein ACFQY8_05790 [Alloscardovia venturai]|uniref:Uncharacterized protein n=1 Tax=Alloscardovia venturai TaxID=1769421 RepID=A0ABW2Y8V2_9BIFI
MMSLEEIIFFNRVPNVKRLHEFGFQRSPDGTQLQWEKTIHDGDFTMRVSADTAQSTFETHVYDTDFDDEYVVFRQADDTGAFAGSVREEVIETLKDIAIHCCDIDPTYTPKIWIVPSNMKLFDLDRAFSMTDILMWQQVRGVKVGDEVFVYNSAPESALRYRCQVIQTHIPYEYKDEHFEMHEVMDLKKLDVYAPEQWNLPILRTYGVTTVRGPRHMPDMLRKAIMRESAQIDKR